MVMENAAEKLRIADKDAEAYSKYVVRKNKINQTPRQYEEWKERSNYYKNNSPMARGNRFDKKAEEQKWYTCNQVHLSNGKRLDSFDPIAGSIVSRKSIDLSKISMRTFETYLKEFKAKYDVGTIIRSNKYDYIDGKMLNGKFQLEIPDYNKNGHEIEKFIKLARKYDVEIIFKPE